MGNVIKQGTAMDIRMLTEAEIRTLTSQAAALAAVREAFIAFAAGKATLPDVIGMEFHEHNGEAHIKGAYVHGTPYWSIKAATGFYDNPALGLPMLGGLSLVFSATTGLLDTLLLDNGYLTELRTGAAGALAADLLANPEIEQALIVGAGGQARYQLDALLGVRQPQRVIVYARRADAAEAYAAEMGARLGIDIAVARELREAVATSDLIVTTTPSRAPLIDADWLRPSVHITAMGSDFPDKQELAVDVLARADLVVADHPPQAATQGEIHHAIEAGHLTLEEVVPLAAIAAGKVPGRTRDDQITVADLTGLGIQDAALANAVVIAATQRGLGQVLRA
ncbi:MAG: ornithine cyclodeaminase family protein [Chloroflexi bacterium]|nr:ornithine cyclodeaminase family protein [Chloroflexota bacterium]